MITFLQYKFRILFDKSVCDLWNYLRLPFYKSFWYYSRDFCFKNICVFVSSNRGPLTVYFRLYPWNPLVPRTGGADGPEAVHCGKAELWLSPLFKVLQFDILARFRWNSGEVRWSLVNFCINSGEILEECAKKIRKPTKSHDSAFPHTTPRSSGLQGRQRSEDLRTASFQKLDLEKWALTLGHLNFQRAFRSENISSGSGIRDPRFETSRIELMRAGRAAAGCESVRERGSAPKGGGTLRWFCPPHASHTQSATLWKTCCS